MQSKLIRRAHLLQILRDQANTVNTKLIRNMFNRALAEVLRKAESLGESVRGGTRAEHFTFSANY